MLSRYAPLLLALLLLLPAGVGAQAPGTPWTWSGAVYVSAGPAETGSRNCGQFGAAAAGGEVRLHRGVLVFAGLVEAIGSMLPACDDVLLTATRSDSVFADPRGGWLKPPRVGVRLGADLPLRSVSLLPSVGGGWVRVDPIRNGHDPRLEPWGSAALELRLWRGLGVRAEHARYRTVEVLEFRGPWTEPAAPDGVPPRISERWEAFTLLGVVVRFGGRA